MITPNKPSEIRMNTLYKGCGSYVYEIIREDNGVYFILCGYPNPIKSTQRRTPYIFMDVCTTRSLREARQYTFEYIQGGFPQ